MMAYEFHEYCWRTCVRVFSARVRSYAQASLYPPLTLGIFVLGLLAHLVKRYLELKVPGKRIWRIHVSVLVMRFTPARLPWIERLKRVRPFIEFLQIPRVVSGLLIEIARLDFHESVRDRICMGLFEDLKWTIFTTLCWPFHSLTITRPEEAFGTSSPFDDVDVTQEGEMWLRWGMTPVLAERPARDGGEW